MRLPAGYSFFQARGRDGSHCARPITSLAADAVHAIFGSRVRRYQQIQDRGDPGWRSHPGSRPGVLSGLAGRGRARYVSSIHTFSGEASRDGRGTVARSRVVSGEAIPRVACRRGQGLGAGFVRPGARQRHEACLSRPVTGPCRRVIRTIARRFLRYQAGISGCSACVFPALACGRLVDLSSAN